MCLNSHFMFDLQHRQGHDGPGLTLHALPTMQDQWEQLTTTELLGVRTTSELTARVEMRYSLTHEQATRDVEFWALDKQL
jgi:hypothetical protein